MAPFAIMALDTAPQIVTPDPNPPTAIEQALIERACGSVSSAGASETDPHVLCLGTQLTSLRADFGRDLRRLSASERRTLDSSCSRLQTTQGREAYLDCIAAQLTVLRNRQNRANRVVAEEAAVAPVPPVAQQSVAPPARETSARSRLLVGVTLTAVAVAAAIVLLAVRGRRSRRVCRVCGTTVRESGDLCPACRHQAAEALRRAAADRAEQLRAQEEERRRQAEQEEAQRLQKARREEEARLHEQEEAHQREEDARRRQAEEALRQSRAVNISGGDNHAEDAFDPYAVLGVPRDTSPENIRAAYEEARTKYDQDSVAHLGVDVQEHFKAKAEAVDRAYQMLAG